jgi:hypothetical protein
MSDISDTISDLQGKLGPKRVKTPQIEIEQFDLKDLANLARSTQPLPTFNQFNWAKVVPKNGCTCEDNSSSCNYRS